MKNSIEDVLEKEGVFVSTTVGTSMYPMLRDRRDTIVISPYKGKLNKYDVPLYKVDGQYILHRVVEIGKDSYTMLGDNRLDKEYGIHKAQIIGVLTGFYRAGKKINMNGLGYKAYARIWYKLYPFRVIKHKVATVFERFDKVDETRKQAEELENTGIYLMELIKAALHDRKAPEKPDGVSWENIALLSKKNSVEALSAYGVKTLEKKPPEELWKKWKKIIDMTTFKIFQFDIEREQILAEMKKKGLSYCPMKGVYIANYYPKPGMRTMSDNDILYGYVERDDNGQFRVRPESQTEAKRAMDSIMIARGYELYLEDEAEDGYKKKPMYNYEMHRGMTQTYINQHAYYENPWKRALMDEKDNNLFRFSLEDEYIFSIVHAYKHFVHAGCGIRHLIDDYVYRNKNGNSMDWMYIGDELELLELTDFRNKLSVAADHFLSDNDEKITVQDMELFFFMLKSGTYGTLSQLYKNSMEKYKSDKGRMTFKGKMKYVKGRIFPSDEWYQELFPICLKYPALKIVIFFFRLFRTLIQNPKKVFLEWKLLLKDK